ncbi:hypothetical protein [Urbifossiella limnaea]|uniref:Uncharacterized protein n=1 Tax=Urbifossiella limnaea TaxID=2528023 RepID=A0A517XUW9_9BACT|nr:hypothetical protein [Urbifossiella limnaea]QDU21279.1 hypothetical protein ETAA1_32450 [Urbifossiella limnaea]
MTADRLARRYAVLRPDERLALMLAASGRGDDAEHERLVATAPRVPVVVPDTFPRYMAFREVLDRHRAERFELTARFFQTKRLEEDYDEGPGGRMGNVARAFGYLLLAARDGWTTFSERAMLPCGGLEVALVGGDVLRIAEDEAERDEVTADEVAGIIAARGGPVGQVRTASSVAEELGEVFAARLGWWEGEGR